MSVEQAKLKRRFTIWQLRQDSLSQAQIAEKLGVSQQQISGDCAFLDEATALFAMIDAAEPPSLPTTNASLNRMEKEIVRLRRLLATMDPRSNAYFKREQEYHWLLQKSGEMRTKLPPQLQEKYEYTVNLGTVRKTKLDTLDPTRPHFEEWVKTSRYHLLKCLSCGSDVHILETWIDAPIGPVPVAAAEANEEDEE